MRKTAKEHEDLKKLVTSVVILTIGSPPISHIGRSFLLMFLASSWTKNTERVKLEDTMSMMMGKKEEEEEGTFMLNRRKWEMKRSLSHYIMMLLQWRWLHHLYGMFLQSSGPPISLKHLQNFIWFLQQDLKERLGDYWWISHWHIVS